MTIRAGTFTGALAKPADNIVTGPRVMLRPLRLADADALFTQVTSDPEVTQYLSCRTHSDVEETRRFIIELFKDVDNRGWIIEWRGTGDLVGLCSWIRPERDSVQFGCSLARRWWGRQIMSEALGLFIQEAVRDPDVHRVWAVSHVDNVRTVRPMERNGMSMEGRLARYCVFPNISTEPQDVFLFAKAVK